MGHHLETQDNRLSACSVKTLWKAKFSYWKLLNWFHPWPNMGFEYWKVGAFIHADMSCSLKKILNVYYLIFKKVGVYNSNSLPGGFSLVKDFFFSLKTTKDLNLRAVTLPLLVGTAGSCSLSRTTSHLIW